MLRCVAPRISGGDFDVVEETLGFRNPFADLPHGIEMGTQRVLEILSPLLLGVTRRDTPDDIRRIRRETGRGLLNNDAIAFRADFSPAFFSIEFKVKSARRE